MKVVLTTTRELKDPSLEISINLDSGYTEVQLKHTCPDCAGYGCHGGGCDDTITLTPDTVVSTLGPDSKAVLRKLFNQILGE